MRSKARLSPMLSSPVVRVIPHRSEEERLELQTLESLIQTLAVRDEVIGLEIAYTEQGASFLVRTCHEQVLEEVMRQLYARYPQAELQRLTPEDDPLVPGRGAQVRLVELEVRGAAYERLRSWSSRDLQTPHADLIDALVASGARLPPSYRAVAQLALSPAQPSWAQRYRRLALSHPLEEERERRRENVNGARRGNVPGWGAIIGLLLLVVGLTAWKYGRLERFLPSWVLPALFDLLHGHLPQLSSEQRALCALAALALVALLAVLAGIGRLFDEHPRFYDQRRVAEKLSKSAYRARLRLYVIETPPPVARQETAGNATFHPQWHGEGALPGMLNQSLLCQWLARSWFGILQRLRILWRCRQQRWAVAEQLAGAYQQYQTATLTIHLRYRGGWKVRRWFLWRSTDLPEWARGIRRARWYLTGEEVALLWHPVSSSVPGISSRQERTLLAPPAVTRGSGWKLGTSEAGGRQMTVFFPPEALRRHTLVLGRTGKGKSTLFHHLALAQLSQAAAASPSPGLVVIEPHGDLISSLLPTLPESLIDQVILIDLARQEAPVSLNLLDMQALWHPTREHEVRREALVSAILTALHGIWSGSWGSRIENVLRYSLLSLVTANMALLQQDQAQGTEQQYTLLDVVPLLSQHAFRRQVLALVSDPFLLEWWQTYYERLDSVHLNDLITPIITKISAYGTASVTRRIIGQSRSTLDLDELVRHGGVLLINTASGIVGEEVSRLLGATLLSHFSSALARQFGVPERERRQFLVLVDEFRTYPANYNVLLSELRKAGLSLVLAAQSLSQLDAFDPALRPTVLGNTDQQFFFTFAGEDAYLLRHEIEVAPEDVVALPDYTCYARWSYEGKRLPLFSFRLDLPPGGDEAVAERIRTRSAQYYGRPVKQVEAAMALVHRLHHPAPQSRRSPTAHGSLPGGKATPRASAPPGPGAPKRVRTRNKSQAVSLTGTTLAQPGSSESLLHTQFQEQTQIDHPAPPLVS